MSAEKEACKNMRKLVLLAVAGACGAFLRYTLVGTVQRLNNSNFPLGTLAVNMTGCLLAGVLWSLFETRWTVSSETRTIVMVGFLGAFTTFSSYILETNEFLRAAEWMWAGANVLLQNGLGLAAFLLGGALGRAL